MKNLVGETPARTLARILAFATLILALALLFVATRILLVPFVAALFVVYLFEPAVVAFQRRGIQRGSAFLVLLSLCVIAIAGMLAFMPAWLRLESVGGSSQTLTEQLTTPLTELERWINSKLPMVGSVGIAAQATEKAASLATAFFQELPALITSFIINLILVPFIAYFMIRDGKRLKRGLVEIVPNRYFEMSLIMFNRIDQQIGGYLRGRLIECILVGITQAIFMGIAAVVGVQQQYILLIAAVCGITNMIPYVGPIMGTIFGAFLYLASGLPISAVYGLVAASALAHLVDNIVIAPAVLSHNVDLHPLTVALVLIIGGELLGTLGLLIAIPVAASIKVVAQEFYTNYQLQVRT